MKARPILFSGPMVRALLDGRKTQTRREVDEKWRPIVKACLEVNGKWVWHTLDYDLTTPYGTLGDLLWVREEHYRFGHWEPVAGVKTKGGRQKWQFVADTDEVLYLAPEEFRKGRHHHDPYTRAWHKRLGRFMPKAYSRIALEITAVRVERLHDISEEDAIAEGIERIERIGNFSPDCIPCAGWQCYTVAMSAYYNPIHSYQSLWESLNGRASWGSDPWVWVIEFKVHHSNVDDLLKQREAA